MKDYCKRSFFLFIGGDIPATRQCLETKEYLEEKPLSQAVLLVTSYSSPCFHSNFSSVFLSFYRIWFFNVLNVRLNLFLKIFVNVGIFILDWEWTIVYCRSYTYGSYATPRTHSNTPQTPPPPAPWLVAEIDVRMILVRSGIETSSVYQPCWRGKGTGYRAGLLISSRLVVLKILKDSLPANAKLYYVGSPLPPRMGCYPLEITNPWSCLQ